MCQRLFESIKSFGTTIKYLALITWEQIVTFLSWFVPRCWYAKDISKEIVLITGAGSGLGRQMALECARLNASLVLWDINEPGLEETKKLIQQTHREVQKKLSRKSKQNDSTVDANRICLTYKVDVSDKQQVAAAAQQVYKDLNSGPNARATVSIGDESSRIEIDSDSNEKYVTILINNAGIFNGLYLHELTDEQIERIVRINILSHFWTVRAFLPNMKKHEHGHIVEIGSIAGYGGFWKQVDYSATKFATVGFEEALSMELEHLGYRNKIYTTSVNPFYFGSNLFTGYNSKAFELLTVDYVAYEAIIAMRCNHPRTLLPRWKSYFLVTTKPFASRQAYSYMCKAIGMGPNLDHIRGAALEVKT